MKKNPLAVLINNLSKNFAKQRKLGCNKSTLLPNRNDDRMFYELLVTEKNLQLAQRQVGDFQAIVFY